MVKGIETFKKWFKGYEDKYVIIGGTACDLLMNEQGLSFRATKDLDLVLIVEALDSRFGIKFWEFINEAGYEHKNKNTGEPQFYRFTKPKSNDYPMMIELFSRNTEKVILPEDAILTPLSLDDNVSSLSAILLDNNYYEFLKQGRTKIDDVVILDVPHLIAFKVKAWLDLSNRKDHGDVIDSKNIKKHKNDVFRLTRLLEENEKINSFIPDAILNDMNDFIEKMTIEDIDLKQFGIIEKTKDEILYDLSYLYGLK